MKRIKLLTAILILATVVFSSCGDDKRTPGKIYMPDMAYSRAVETYTLLDSAKFTDNPANLGKEIFYNRRPVDGTIGVGEMFPYTLTDDSAGYAMSAQIKNPLPPLTGKDSVETARLFNINCAICHGAKGVADGPLSTSGKVGAVANLTTDAYNKMADGTMFHSITYGRKNVGMMGSYASQLNRKQRWQIVQYVRMLQPKASAAVAAQPVATADSTTAKKGK
jgi:mono/diheme cytochrome c family protein